MNKINPRLVRNLTLLAAAVCLAQAVATLVTGRALMLVGPLSMAVLLLGILYSVWQRRRAGMVSRGYFRLMVGLLAAGAVMNVIAAASQLVVLLGGRGLR